MYYVGIDIGKRMHELTAIDEKGNIVSKSIRFGNDRVGFEKLLSFVSAVSPEKQSVQFALESTGHYWLVLYHFLTNAGFTVLVLNPLQTEGQRRSHIRKTKTDKKDSLIIAKLLRLGDIHISYVPSADIFHLRDLVRFRFGLSDSLGDLKRKVISILDKVFPEYEKLFSNIFIKTSKTMLQENWSLSELASMDLSKLTAVLKKESHGHFGLEKAQEIQSLATTSVGLSFLQEASKIELSCLMQHISFIEKQLIVVDMHIVDLYQKGTFNKHLLTIPGINKLLAAGIVSEIGDIARFTSETAIVAFSGLDPSVYQSGEYQGTISHVSKRGSAHLRRYLWLATETARKKNPDLETYFKKKLSQGKQYNVAYGATVRKLLIRVYTVLKENRPYVIR